MYDLAANSLGTEIIGYVWQSIKVVNITIPCTNNQNISYNESCGCPGSNYWNYGNYSCVNLNCNGNSINSTNPNSCSCPNGYFFNKVFAKCMIDCYSSPNAISTNLANQPDFCICAINYNWDPSSKSCIFNCSVVAYSTGNLISSGLCECIPSFIWNNKLNECVCPDYMKPD